MLTINPVAYPTAQSWITPGQSATITATSDQTRDVNVVLTDGASTGSAVVHVHANITATVPAGSGVTLVNTGPGTFVLTA